MEQTQGYIETPFFASLKNWFYDLVQGDPETPDRQDKLGGKKQKRPESKMKTRNKVYKVRMSDTELQKLRDGNVENIARFLRESAMAAVGGREQKQVYTKLDRELLLELSRIGNNINQVAKVLNTIRQDPKSVSSFSFLECFHVLSQIQNDLHDWLGELPKIKRSPEAVERARERARDKKMQVGDVH